MASADTLDGDVAACRQCVRLHSTRARDRDVPGGVYCRGGNRACSDRGIAIGVNKVRRERSPGIRTSVRSQELVNGRPVDRRQRNI
jgi:hypothetical protein